MTRRHSNGLLLLSAMLTALPACRRRSPAPTSAAASAKPGASTEAPPALPHGPFRFVVIGGGATPESTEVSLEQDVDLVQKTFPGPGAVLFAGGSASKSVRELDPSPRGDDVLLAVGALFHPRAGRSSRYRAPRFAAERATLDDVELRLKGELAQGEAPLLLYVAAHGDQGATARDNSIALWGGRALTVARLAELSDAAPRPLRVVATSCYSGGFADLAFSRADEKEGASGRKRCGLFAGTWDRQTSGCDANPDRRAQESYGLHFIHALSHQDRTGAPLTDAVLDTNHDGVVGLLDAHTRATIAAVSLDVPTTTSERYLRAIEKGTAPVDPKLLPEAGAVVDQLGASLGLRDEAAVDKRWAALEEELDDLDEDLDSANDSLAEAEGALGARLLEKWPVLDDAYHPEFASSFAQNRGAIAKLLDHSPEAKRVAETRKISNAADDKMTDLEVEEARVLRLRRAWETLHLAASLTQRGGKDADHYRELLACERAAP